DVFITQTAAPSYRYEFFVELKRRAPFSVCVAAGDEYFTHEIATSAECRAILEPATNRFLLGRRALWQSGVVRRGLQANVAIVELNGHIVSTWAILVLRRLSGRPVIAWGHAMSRGTSGRVSRLVRRSMRALANAVIVYTDGEVEQLATCQPS